jgi:hypothetical protein
METRRRLLLITALATVGVVGVVALVLVSGSGERDRQSDEPVADRFGLPSIIREVVLCGDIDYNPDPGIAPQASVTAQSIDPGILAPTRSTEGLALRVVPERTPCDEPAGTPTP